MTPSYHIRQAERTDLIHLPDIELASNALFPEGRIPDLNDAMPLGKLERAQEDGLVWVAEAEGRLVGFAMSGIHGDLLHLNVMAVHPDYGRRGVGTQLLEAVIRQAAERGLKGVTLTTFADLPFNGPFYAKNGFRTLEDAELNPMLRDMLTQESSQGMTNRVAMLHVLSATAT